VTSTRYRGRFVTFEGIEGVGKSTQLESARALLSARGMDVLATREPGGTPLGERLRALVLSREESLGAATELLIMLAARAEHVARVIRPALERGAWVLCDRYSDATFAYQGGGRGLSDRQIAPLAAFAESGLRPDLTLLLDAPVPVALARARGRGGAGDRFEAETAAFFQRVRARYLRRARTARRRIRVINAARPADQVAAAVAKAILALVGRRP
jgi:dTMP kinase